MAKNSIRDFSATAGSNTDIQSVNIDENCPASGINNALRELMVDLKNVSTGAVNLETPVADTLGVGAAPNATFGATLYLQKSPAVNKPIFAAYSTGNSSNAGIAILNDSGNRGIWTEGSAMRFTRTYEGNSTADMTIDSSGDILIGQSTADSPGVGNTTAGAAIGSSGRIFSSVNGAWSFFNRNSNDGQVIGFGRGGTQVGSINVTSSNTSFNTSSDYRLKENVTDMTGAIDRVKALAPKRFNFIVNPDTTVDGFLAHEAQTVVPEAVTGTKDGMRDEEYEVASAVLDDEGNEVTPAKMGTRSVVDYQGIDQSKLVPLLTGALQEAIAKIETLETKVAALEA